MKRNIFYVFLLSLILSACKKDGEILYNSGDNIYLNYKDRFGNPDTTTLTYSFSEHPELAKDTIWVPVIISGKTAAQDRKFAVNVVDTLTTGVKDLHYEPLMPFYIMPADSGTIHIPVIIKNIDPQMSSVSIRLTILVSGGDDFNSDLPLNLRMKSFLFSNRLEKPEWWEWWAELGDYSRVKHQLFLISSGTTVLSNPRSADGYLYTPRSLYYIDNARTFLNDPFTWIERYPEKEYVLTKRSDGTDDYDFYSAGSPEKKFYLKYYPQLGKYFFADENGNQIIIN